MTLHAGIRAGIQARIRAGLNPGGVTRDGPASAIATPASAAEWTALGLTAPNALFPCNAASGNLTDVIAAVTATAANSPSYENAVTDWTRPFVGFTEGSTNQRFGLGLGVFNPATASQASLIFAKVETVSVASRRLFGVASDVAIRFTTGGLAQALNGGNVTSGAYDYRDGAVHPFLLIHNITAGSTSLFTDKETITVTYATTVDSTTKGLGATATGGTTPVCKIGYWAQWSGAAAEAVGKTTVSGLSWAMAY